MFAFFSTEVLLDIYWGYVSQIQGYWWGTFIRVTITRSANLLLLKFLEVKNDQGLLSGEFILNTENYIVIDLSLKSEEIFDKRFAEFIL